MSYKDFIILCLLSIKIKINYMSYYHHFLIILNLKMKISVFNYHTIMYYSFFHYFYFTVLALILFHMVFIFLNHNIYLKVK